MTQQLQLPMRIRKTADQQALDDARTLVNHLRAVRHARNLSAEQHARALGWNDRRIRAAAQAANGAVLSAPGCTGYRLAEFTPVADYYATERARYLSQIHDMQTRLAAMDRAVHAHA